MNKRDLQINTFHDGRRHALKAVQVSMAGGEWTAEKRAWLLRHAVRLRHVHLDQAQQKAYYAGLLSVLKSHLSTDFSEEWHAVPIMESLSELRKSTTTYYLLQPDELVFCELEDCRERATWIGLPQGELTKLITLCDRCKQERVREEVVQGYTRQTLRMIDSGYFFQAHRKQPRDTIAHRHAIDNLRRCHCYSVMRNHNKLGVLS
jgi:hypothetical protein